MLDVPHKSESLFAPGVTETHGAMSAEESEGWKVIVSDDDEMVHQVTEMALRNFRFSGRNLEFFHAYSGREAVDLVRQHPDAAVILLDVVMETEESGLNAVRAIRDRLGNAAIRIILRTGQPGQAPEHKVVAEYDINDYKEKTELTRQKLETTMYAALRSFRDITALDDSRRGLEKVIEASASISEMHSLEKFSAGVLEQLGALLSQKSGAFYCKSGSLAAEHVDGSLNVIAGTGAFSGFIGQDARRVVAGAALETMLRAVEGRDTVQEYDRLVAYFRGREGGDNLAYFDGARPLNPVDRHLVEIFCRNVSIAFDNLYLRRDIEDTQRELVYRLSEAVETRSRETGNHVKRVAEYARLLARAIGISAEAAEVVRLAAPLHDVGKVGVPDHILNKAGTLTTEEWSVMKNHSQMGYDMLKDSGREIVRAGAIIAYEHHEKWDGTGYPCGKSGTNIHIYGRIVALADVFDALGSDRCYKKAWPHSKIRELLTAQAGRHFDPDLVRIFFDREQEFLAIRDRYPDVMTVQH